MIDTVRIPVVGRWPSEPPDESWRFKSGGLGRDVGDAERRWVNLQHVPSGFRLHGTDEGPMHLECSVPRLLHQSNSVCLRDQFMLSDGLNAVRAMAAEAGVREVWDDAPSRVDLVWQVRGDLRTWSNSLRCARHPRIKRGPVVYPNGGLQWKGSDRVVRVYDKLRELKDVRGLDAMALDECGEVVSDVDVIRTEVQLRGEAVKRLHGGVLRNFDACWSLYRGEVLDLTAAVVPDQLDVVSLLALLQAEGVEYNGVPLVDLYLGSKAKRSQQLWRKRIAEKVMHWSRVDLHGTFREVCDNQPAGVHIWHKAKSREVA